MADRAITTDVDTNSTVLEVPGASDPGAYMIAITPLAAAWVSPYGADAVAKADNCVYIPAGVTRKFLWNGTGVNGCAASGTTSIVVETFHDSELRLLP